MHRSRVGVVLIDHPRTSAGAGRAFWAGVQGVALPSLGGDPGAPGAPDGPGGSEDPYVALGAVGGLPGGPRLEHQVIGDPGAGEGGGPAPRIHLDIETDDVTAEVARVVGLGAQVVERHERYAVLADPAGLLFCVVPSWTDGFAAGARAWPDAPGEDRGLDAYPARTHDKVRYADTDRQGHVNNAVFAVFLETGRVEILRDPARPLGDRGTEWVLARVELDLRAEVTWPGTVEIGTGVLRVGRSSVTLRQGLFQGGRPVAEAETVLVQTGADPDHPGRRRGVPLGAGARERLAELTISS